MDQVTKVRRYLKYSSRNAELVACQFLPGAKKMAYANKPTTKILRSLDQK